MCSQLCYIKAKTHVLNVHCRKRGKGGNSRLKHEKWFFLQCLEKCSFTKKAVRTWLPGPLCNPNLYWPFLLVLSHKSAETNTIQIILINVCLCIFVKFNLTALINLYLMLNLTQYGKITAFIYSSNSTALVMLTTTILTSTDTLLDHIIVD